MPSNNLTCFGVGGTATRVYYQGSGGNIYEFAWVNGWVHNQLTGSGGLATGAPSAVAGTALACFGVDGTASRVYYQGPSGNIYELAWVNGWVHNQLTGSGGLATGAPSAAAGTALACFGVGGTASRVYYVVLTANANNNVWELAWDNGWSSSELNTASVSVAPPVSGNSGIACFGVGGAATRLYYLSSDGTVMNEMAWQNRWVNRALWIIQPPASPVAAPTGGLTGNVNYFVADGGCWAGSAHPRACVRFQDARRTS
jgi:Fungal fucose-specific lectin